MNLKTLPLRNLRKRPGRTVALTLVVALLALTLFGGSAVVLALRGGLNSLEARLGADIIVVPASAKSKVNLDNLFLQGTTGYYYMTAANVEKLRGIDGVEKVSPQVFLASLRADCCSVPIQVIGIDQQSDFSIQPWIAQSYSGTLGERELVVGSKVSTPIGSAIRIYQVNCPVVARLAETGTGLDTAVYASMETVSMLLEAARGLGHDLQISGDVGSVVSAVYIKVRDGVDVEQVTNDINLHVRKVSAVQTRSMITGISDSLAGVARTVTLLIAVVWVLAAALLAVVFTLLMGSRRREFAVLRVIGVSRRGLSGMVLREALCIGLMGGVLGIVLALGLLFPFTGLMEQQLGLPFLLPGLGTLALLAALTLLAALIVAPLASALAARRVSRVDTGIILREN